MGSQIQPYLDLEDGAEAEIFVYPDPLVRSFDGWGEYGGWLLGEYAYPAHGNDDLNFVAELIDGEATAVRQISSLNAAAAAQVWPVVTTRTWKSDDGKTVEGLLIHAMLTEQPHKSPSPLSPNASTSSQPGPERAESSSHAASGFHSTCSGRPSARATMR